MTTPAGWYDDGSGNLRWWDGQQWTAHVRAVPHPSPEGPTETAVEPAADPAAQPAVEPAAALPSEVSLTGAADPEPFAPPYSLQPQAAGYPGAAEAPSYPSVAAYPGAAQGYAAAPGMPTPAPARKISVLGLIGLGAAVVGVVLACVPPIAVIGWVVLGIAFVVSLVSLFLRGTKWPGITGMGVTVFGTILALAVSLIAVGLDSSVEAGPGPVGSPSARPSTDDSAQGAEDPSEIEGAEMVSFDELAVGDCIPLVEYDEEETEVFEVPVVPCDLPHTDEVFYKYDLPDGEYPGDDAIYELAWEGCRDQFEGFVGLSYDASELDIYPYSPTQGSWNRWNDRTVHCIVFSYDEVTGSLQGAAR
ncbi:DUF2510 domain-containing protein [Microbacterium sp. EST19A]|uniref:DUF2510 domain-containing protein n=1 Tax=Microbacterium sp. EST19A TaxID=2862681 RepID=UPI001CBBA444|nr:DUF2510 domain-containing protein [Microbacterium sp. EST19A]